MPDFKKLIDGMTIDEKIGQLLQYDAYYFIKSEAGITGPLQQLGLQKEDLYRVGNILNFKNADEMIRLQKAHLEGDRNKIPLLFMMDVIHGFRTIFPIPIALGASFDPELVEELSRMAATEAASAGVHVTFTPMVDYSRDARWGRLMESCGEEPMLTCLMGAAQIKGFHGKGIENDDTLATCVKHFAAYGGAEAGRDYNQVELSEHILREFYLPSYKACIDADTDMLMPSFNVLNGVPAVANSWLMKTILRDEWGYEGLVITDYNAIGELLVHGNAENLKDATAYAFKNKCDIDMCSNGYNKHLKELLDEGIISEEELDCSVMKVLKLKEKLGLFENPYRAASRENEINTCLSEENRKLARKGANECAVLLKNNGVLPFKNNVKKVAVIGPFADEHKIIGFWFCHGEADESVTVAEGIKNKLPDAEIKVAKGCSPLWGETDRDGFNEAIEAAKNADIVILCLGEPQDYSGEGNSRTNLDLPGVQNELVEEIVKVNPNTAVLLFTGRPLAITKLDSIAPAILNMWFPGTEGGNAAADLLFGDVNPSAKITMTFPKTVGQCPIYYNHTNTGRPVPKEVDGKHLPYMSNYIDCGNLPLYSFGYGLSYSNFVYEDMKLSDTEMTMDGEITVDITVYNDSDREGKETVQLYMRDMVASTARPVQQLIAFEKVNFKPYERKMVKFTVKEPMLRFWNNDNEFVSEKGLFKLSVGYADNMIFTKDFYLK